MMKYVFQKLICNVNAFQIDRYNKFFVLILPMEHFWATEIVILIITTHYKSNYEFVKHLFFILCS
jgi:hypothetical protein